MNYGRVYSATFENVTIGATNQSIMELQVPDNTIITLLRAWLSADIGQAPPDEVIAVNIYGNDAAGTTSGSTLTKQPLTPAAAADASNITAEQEPTIGATELDLYQDAYHLANGWLYLPVPDERIVIFGGNADPGDNIGLQLSVTSTATPNVSGGMIWLEISAA
jgi:hypothetical protein